MKKYLIAATVAVMVFAVSAFAASLDVSAGTLQAGQDEIDKCVNEPDVVDVSYMPATLNDGVYEIDEIELDNKGNCVGMAFQVAITDDQNVAITDPYSGTFDADPYEVTFDAAFPAEAAHEVHLVIRNGK
jgi:hypothetical protein